MNKVYVVGIGSGNKNSMTREAYLALKEAEVLCGYTVYVDLVKPIFPEKETYSSPMMKERERCLWALAEAEKGRCVAVISSGDAEVYAMASLVIELSVDFEVEVQIISGVTAALSGGALLGAPLGHDFCVISLSDWLTPWEVIEKRLKAAAFGDFALCIYNPSSKKRWDYLQKACDILLENGKSPETVCGLAKNIGRAGEEKRLLSLKELRNENVDMFTTVFVGNSSTKAVGDFMVSPRGYDKKCGF